MSGTNIRDSPRNSFQQFSFRLPHAFHCKKFVEVSSSVKQIMRAEQVPLKCLLRHFWFQPLGSTWYSNFTLLHVHVFFFLHGKEGKLFVAQNGLVGAELKFYKFATSIL